MSRKCLFCIAVVFLFASGMYPGLIGLWDSACISSFHFVAETKWIHFYWCENQFTDTDVQQGTCTQRHTKQAISVGLAPIPILAQCHWMLFRVHRYFAALPVNWNFTWFQFLSIPGLLGIQDLSKPNYGDPVHLHPGDVPVFWACGVTAVEAVINSSIYYVWRLFLNDNYPSVSFFALSLCFFNVNWMSLLISRLDFRVS